MNLVQRIAIALYGDFAVKSEPCMAAAQRACGVFADFLESQEAHDICDGALLDSGDMEVVNIWAIQRALAKAARQDCQVCGGAAMCEGEWWS